MTDTSATFETRKDAGEGGPGTFKLWMRALDLAGEEEKKWRDKGNNANERYRDEKERQGSQFNILYSSVQTQAPAIYNSTPEPDVRRRFNDKDITGKLAAQVFERSLSHCIDEYDFDSVMEACVNDSLLPGRGVALVEYDPVLADDQLVYETTRAVHVQWDDFRRGPGKEWIDVPWVAVRYRITREAAIALNPKDGPTVTLDHIETGADKEESKSQVHDIFKRLTIWKIWDKSRREIIFIAPSFKEGPFAVEQDTLNLEDFFPFPEPIYDIKDSTSLIPLVPYEMYRDQAEELDTLTKRIASLTKVLKWRGIRPSNITEFDRLADAKDGELVPSDSMSTVLMTQGADADRAIWLMPIDRLIVVIRELVLQREQVKQVVFELSGLADIMRGETDPNETLGAQQIKAQWGTMRMQRRQREVQRFARDIMRLKAEIIGEQYSVETLSTITGIELPTQEGKQAAQLQIEQAEQTGQEPPKEVMDIVQVPTWAEVKQVMSSDALRSFRIDIETDSTIAADDTRAQQNMATFIEGVAAFTSAFGPGVESGQIPKDVATDILKGFSRNFRLGKQAEDALDRLGEESRRPQQEDPEAQIQAAEAQQAQQEQAMKAQQMQGELQLKSQTAQQELALKRQIAEEDMAMKREAAALDAKIKATQGGVTLPDEDVKLDALLAGMNQLGEILQATLREVRELKDNAEAPVEITPVRQNGRLVGAERRQGNAVTSVTIN